MLCRTRTAGDTNFTSFHTHTHTHTHRYRIDCIGCDALTGKDPGFASGAVCNYHNATSGATRVRLCRRAAGDATDWDDRTTAMLVLARQGLVSGALRGTDQTTCKQHSLEATSPISHGFPLATSPKKADELQICVRGTKI